MKLTEHAEVVAEVRRIYEKIQHGKPLTPEETERAEREWPRWKRCGCCGKILGEPF